jgi:predicted aspartyl protease
LKIGDSKRKEVINEWKSLSGEYNNGVVFPCIQLAQNKARQKNDMYNPNDIIGSVDSSTIELLRIGDSKMVQVTIGDITKYYVLDTGADLLIIDDKSEHELISNKKLLPSMFIGEKQLTLADNRQVNAKIYKINNVRIGDYIVRNIEIGVIENGFLLCGMSLLKKFKDWKIESELNVLKLFK